MQNKVLVISRDFQSAFTLNILIRRFAAENHLSAFDSEIITTARKARQSFDEDFYSEKLLLSAIIVDYHLDTCNGAELVIQLYEKSDQFPSGKPFPPVFFLYDDEQQENYVEHTFQTKHLPIPGALYKPINYQLVKNVLLSPLAQRTGKSTTSFTQPYLKDHL